MKVWENRLAAADLMQRIRDSRQPRTPGIHLSDLTGCTRKAWYFLHNPDDYTETDDATLIFSMGKGFHNLFELQGEREVMVEGIILTPDEIDVGDDGSDVVVDFKTVRTSSNKGPHELTTQIDQLGGYCALVGTRFGRIHIVHLVGDYTPRGSRPVHRCYDFEFEDWEIQEWRREILRRRDMIMSANDFESIPIGEHYKSDWECNYCPLKGNVCPGGGGERLPGFPNYEITPGTFAGKYKGG